MSRKLTLICALLGLVAFLAMPAYAEVQNIKVSGDITALGVYRSHYDLQGPIGDTAGGDTESSIVDEADSDAFLQSIVRLRVDADLTDNVSAAIQLANQREWDVVLENASTNAEENINLDLAYITLKEMLYSPLTLVIGRQNLMYGNGLIVGPGLYQDPGNSIKYDDLGVLHGFDAIRAIFDYDPWTLDLVAVKLTENNDAAEDSSGFDDDVDLYGVNLGYRYGSYDAEMEGYFFFEKDNQYNLVVDETDTYNGTATNFNESKTYVVGVRGSVTPIENLSINAEIAGQFGEIYGNEDTVSSGTLERDREAMAANVAAKYDFADVRFAPTLGVEYLYLSGEKGNGDGSSDNDFEAWDPIYRGKIMGTIRDCLENLYTTDDPGDTSGWTNQHTIKATGYLDLGELVDGLSLDLAYLHYWFDEIPLVGAEDTIGDEINVKLTYDYTEDVEFAIDGALFMPGDYYDDVHGNGSIYGGGMTANNTAQTAETIASNDNAVSIVGSCKVSF